MSEIEARGRLAPAGSWIVLAIAIGFCAAHGIASTAGLAHPPDVDQLRDLGAIQGILDGNWFGDPVNAGEWRWYPPLIHAVAALAIWLTGAPPLTVWAEAGAWINLLTPVAFFVMTRRLLGASTALIALLALILLNGSMRSPWLAASYTPWPFTPNMALPFFFIGIWLIDARACVPRLRDAVMIGAALGLTFLAHPVPALLLSAIVTAVVLDRERFTLRALGHLAAVAVTEIVLALVFLAPLLLHYRLRTVNPAPVAWTDVLMDTERHNLLAIGLLNLPGVVAMIGVWAMRNLSPLPRRALIILGTWIGVCAGFLLRHYACALLDTGESGVCRAFILPLHHFLFYLQAAWACLIGHALWQTIRSGRHHAGEPQPATVLAPLATAVIVGAVVLWSLPGLAARLDVTSEINVDIAIHGAWAALVGVSVWLSLDLRRRDSSNPGLARAALWTASAAALLLASAAWLFVLPADRAEREAGLTDGDRFDRAGYDWIMRNTRPADLFVTELALPYTDPAAMTVMAAARRLVAAPLLHSNPYIDWQSRDARRQAYISALSAGDARRLCDLKSEAGSGASAWFFLPASDSVDPTLAEEAYRTEGHVLYGLKPLTCGSS